MKVKVLKEVEVEVKYLYAYLGDYMYLEDLNFMDDEANAKVALMDGDLKKFLKDNPNLDAANYADPDTGEEYCGICLKIDIDNGKVVNWPEELHEVHFIDVKIVDSGTYVLTDKDENTLITKEGYVPNCLQIEENGYGDYLEFVIDKNGFIMDWSFNKDDMKNFEEY